MGIDISWKSSCRICKSSKLESIIDFGSIALTGVFAKEGNEVPNAPMLLSRCRECGLCQLQHSYDSSYLYGTSYGYESHLNSSMVSHLQLKARNLEMRYLNDISDPLVVDIASNDGTLLSGYSSRVTKVGIDPLIDIVSNFYPQDAIKLNNFFDEDVYFRRVSRKANLVTSLSVIYDLDDPIKFAREVANILEDGGIWHFEQSYLVSMVKTLSYDTICHEHILYLRLTDIMRILSESGFQIKEASLNEINGGSIAVTAIKQAKKLEKEPFVEYLIKNESLESFTDDQALLKFARSSVEHKKVLKCLLEDYKNSGYEIFGLGASTKGNVLLQWCNLNKNVINFIGDINQRKFGLETPGTSIPIVDEREVFEKANPKSISLVLPWHFRSGIVAKSKDYLAKGGRLLFPLPNIEIVN